MRRFCVALLFMIGIVFAGTSAMAANSAPLPYAGLEKWVGQYPSVDQRTMKPYPAGQSFWDEPVVAAGMKAALSKAYEKLARTCYGEACAETKISKFGNYVMAWVCQRSECKDNSVRLYVDLENGRTEACVRTSKAKLSEKIPGRRIGIDLWYYPSFKEDLVPRALPIGECDKLSGEAWVKAHRMTLIPRKDVSRSIGGGLGKK